MKVIRAPSWRLGNRGGRPHLGVPPPSLGFQPTAGRLPGTPALVLGLRPLVPALGRASSTPGL
eukprot:8294465-Alexandrium_andersonii.AAC.1